LSIQHPLLFDGGYQAKPAFWAFADESRFQKMVNPTPTPTIKPTEAPTPTPEPTATLAPSATPVPTQAPVDEPEELGFFARMWQSIKDFWNNLWN